MKQVIVVLLLMIAGAVVAAPAPKARPQKGPPQLTPGDYHYEWGGDTNNLSFEKNGQYQADWMGISYYGFWRWDSKSRTLYIWEACDEGAKGRMEVGDRRDMDAYQFTMDDEFKVKDDKDHLLWLKPGKIEVPPDFQWWMWL